MKAFVGLFLAGVLLVLIGSACGESSTSADQTTTGTPEQRLQEALSANGATGDLEVKDVSVEGTNGKVTVQPAGGSFQGSSCADLDDGAQAVFETIYNDAAWEGDATVVYLGGLVNEATGEELPGAKNARYKMTAEQAEQIDWSDEEALSDVNWSTYRESCRQESE
jgi:hypothetical protein